MKKKKSDYSTSGIYLKKTKLHQELVLITLQHSAASYTLIFFSFKRVQYLLQTMPKEVMNVIY